MSEKKSKKLLQQMLSYQFINKGISLHEILNDIDLDGIIHINISEIKAEDVEDSGYWHLWDYEDLPYLINRYKDLKLTIDRFIKEGLDLSEFTITEQPAHNCFAVQWKVENQRKKKGEGVGIDLNIEKGVAVPYYIDNHTDLPYNMFKANSIIEAFEKNNF